MAKYSHVYQSNTNDKRAAVEGALAAAGLVQVAGGTRFRYFGLPTQSVEGYMVRVGIKAHRLVRRVRISGKLEDLGVGAERYHGKYTAEDVTAWARALKDAPEGQVQIGKVAA